MMKRASELIGRAVVSADAGTRMGKVSDVLVDAQSHQVLGLVVVSGMLGAEQVLPFTNVQTLGTDAVVARSGAGLIDRKEWRQQAAGSLRTSSLTHKRVLTTSGRAVGEVRDVLLDDAGAVEAFEIGGSTLGGLLRRRSTLPHGHGVTIGTDAVLVPDEAAAELHPAR